ncbi:AraC family transcriptional regulator [Variovorax sp. JS1663]|uniref:AraC family transcriptional regulator n=1 Tax=Variovorax sp. JS1663 TaxID=1851577 RepID=UPI000B347B25|nr:AraC family transcriptional regulator [Variovorax sp. JS1663]
MPRATASANVLTGFGALMRSLGADPAQLLRRARIPLSALSDPQARLPVTAVARLLEDAAQRFGCPDLGLRLSQARRLSHFGAVGKLARDEPDVRHALQAISAWMYLHSEVSLDLQESEGSVALCAYHGDAVAASSPQVIDLVAGGIFQIMRHLCGPQWHPQAVCLAHAAPADARSYRRYFGCPVAFDADGSALFIAPEDLALPLAEADPIFRSESERQLQAWAGLKARPVEARVRELIGVMLPSGRCTMANVALRLGLQERTLRRHLDAAGLSFASELEAARRELARRYVERSDKSIGAIAGLLGFSETSAFSRWFRKGFGCGPKAWRISPSPNRPR